MSDPAIIEVKAALEIALNWADENDDRYIFSDALAALPLIRAEALEEAAVVAEERERREKDNDGESVYIEACRDIAYDIRALKEQPTSM